MAVKRVCDLLAYAPPPNRRFEKNTRRILTPLYDPYQPTRRPNESQRFRALQVLAETLTLEQIMVSDETEVQRT